ncbi:hypothetical protein [Qipengyuania sp. ASV99]|uniref:hypothetical protein n=1 Tax=Qipengyuania sp. ASV99 TaxID=3399681 RepID=UPI003A4C68B9
MSNEPTPQNEPATAAASNDAKRDELRARIEASERRIAERTLAEQAQEAAIAAGDFARKNPLTVVGGAIAIGLIIGAMTSPGRRVASSAAKAASAGAAELTSSAAKSVGNAVKTRGSALGTLIADAAIAYGIKLIDEAMDSARASKDAAENIGDSAAAKVRALRRDAVYVAGTATDKGRTAAQKTRRRAARAVRDLTDRISN